MVYPKLLSLYSAVASPDKVDMVQDGRNLLHYTKLKLSLRSNFNFHLWSAMLTISHQLFHKNADFVIVNRAQCKCSSQSSLCFFNN